MTPDELQCLAESLIQDLLNEKGDKLRAALACDALFERCSEDIQEAQARFAAKGGPLASRHFIWIFENALNDRLFAHSSHQSCPLW